MDFLKKWAMKGMEWTKQRKAIASVIVIAFLLIIWISVEAITVQSPRETVQQFEQAVFNNDIDTLEDMVSPDDSKMEVDQKHLKQLIQQMQEDNEFREATLIVLRTQADHFMGGVGTSNDPYSFYGTDAFDVNTVGDYYLKEEPGVFFDSYSIGIRPYYMHLKVEQPDGKVKVDGEEVFQSNKEEKVKRIGPLMPGEYVVEGKKKYPYAHVQDKQTVNLFHDEDRIEEVTVDLAGKSVRVTSAFADTEIIVNGKKTGDIVKDIQQFGPVSKDGSVTIQGQQKFPWGVSKSDKVKVTDKVESIDITPKPYANKKGKDQLIQTINTFAQQWVSARNNQKASTLKVASDNLKKELTEEIERDQNGWGDPYKGTALGTRIALDQLEFTYEDEFYTVTVPVEFHNKETDGGLNDEMEENFIQNMVTLRYDEKNKQWTVHDTDYLHLIDSDFESKGTVKSEFK